MSSIPLPSNVESSVRMMLSTATCIVPMVGRALVPKLPPFVNWVKEDGVDVSISAVEISKLIADAAVSSPFVGMAAGILANILTLISKGKGNREVELRIVQRCARFISTVSAHFGAENVTLLPSFKQFEADLRNIQLHIKSNPKTHLARLKRLISADNYATQLQDLQIRVEDAMTVFQTITLMSIHGTQHN